MDEDEKKALLAVIHSQTRQIDWLCGELAIRFCPRCPPDMLGPENRKKPCPKDKRICWLKRAVEMTKKKTQEEVENG